MNWKIVAVVCLLAGFAQAAPQPGEGAEDGSNKVVKYKKGKDVNFEQLIIEGALKRPELSVVTGDDEQGTNGLLRLRENFLDRMTADAGEEVQ
jgi:hypothetical protein